MGGRVVAEVKNASGKGTFIYFRHACKHGVTCRGSVGRERFPGCDKCEDPSEVRRRLLALEKE
jgi:hypothetical protein